LSDSKEVNQTAPRLTLC